MGSRGDAAPPPGCLQGTGARRTPRHPEVTKGPPPMEGKSLQGGQAFLRAITAKSGAAALRTPSTPPALQALAPQKV